MPLTPHPSQSANLTGPTLPPAALLAEFAPMPVWHAAWKTAAASNSGRFRMGAAIFGDGEIVTGYSHRAPRTDRLASTHAELHALQSGAGLDLVGGVCVVVGLNRRGNGCPWSCCPCTSCATALAKRGIATVCYPERMSNGAWQVKMESPSDMLARASAIPEHNALFARHQRLAAPLSAAHQMQVPS